MASFNPISWTIEFLISHFLSKSFDYQIDNALGKNKEKENAITQAIQLEKQLAFYDGLEDEFKQTKAMLVEIVSTGKTLEHFDFLKEKLRNPDWEWDGDPYKIEELMRDAVEYHKTLPENSDEKNEFAGKAGEFFSIAQSDFFTLLLNKAKTTSEHIQRKPLVYDKYVAEQEALYDAYPWLPQAIQNIPADSEDPTLSTILQAFNDIYTKIDTVVEELTATDTSLEEQISSLLGIETSLEGHESNLSTAVANIPNTIATMAPIQVYCSGGGGSQDASPTVEMGVDSVIEGVRHVVNGLSINLDGEKVGSYVDGYINRRAKSHLAGRGVFFG